MFKKNENFTTYSGVKTYVNWFDGWAVDQYTADDDGLKYFNRDRKLLEYTGKFDIKEQWVTETKLRTPNSIPGILNLEQYWNEDVDEYEKANSNFWMFHLEKQVHMLTKKELSLENFKSMDCFFTQQMLQKEESIYQFTDKQKQIFLLSEDDQVEWFADKSISVEEKYATWKAIDMLNRHAW